MEYNDSNLDRSIVKQGELVNEFIGALTPNEWKIYSKKILEVMDNTYGDLNRTDVIGDKIISTTIKDAKEQITSVLKSKTPTIFINFIEEVANEYGYTGKEVQEFIEEVYGKKMSLDTIGQVVNLSAFPNWEKITDRLELIIDDCNERQLREEISQIIADSSVL